MNLNKHNHFTLRITQVFTQLLRDKWNIRKGYLKIHVAVDVKSKKILSMKVTDESTFMIARHYRNWSRIL
jgi:hypothetical protein